MIEKKKAEIHKNLRRKYDHIKSLGFDIFAVILYGSQNYNLDIYTDKYQSDIDAYAIVIPGVKEIVNTASPISKEIDYEGEKIIIKDIRLFFNLIVKQNLTMLELLFSDYKITNPLYRESFKQLWSLRGSIANYDKKSFVMCCSGFASEMLDAFTKNSKGIDEQSQVYGYNFKSLIHLLRVHELLYRFIDLEEPMSSELFQVKNIVKNIVEIKSNSLLLEDARIFAVIFKNYCKEYGEKEFEKSPVKIPEMLEEIKQNIIVAKIKNDLLEIEGDKLPKKTKIKKSGRIFVTSDLHFYHDNIITYENRPFENIEAMNKKLIENWNAVIQKNDTVYILGDFSFADGEKTNEILKQLNGIKILIEGNHDLFLEDKKFDYSLLDGVSRMEEISYKGSKFFLCHYPLRSWKKSRHGTIHLYGHVHTKKEHSGEPETKPISVNIGTDLNNYTPILLDDLLDKIKEE